jgi:hypothetical protein
MGSAIATRYIAPTTLSAVSLASRSTARRPRACGSPRRGVPQAVADAVEGAEDGVPHVRDGGEAAHIASRT